MKNLLDISAFNGEEFDLICIKAFFEFKLDKLLETPTKIIVTTKNYNNFAITVDETYENYIWIRFDSNLLKWEIKVQDSFKPLDVYETLRLFFMQRVFEFNLNNANEY